MAFVLFLSLTALVLASCHADTTVTNYIYWKKADIEAWHQYFPSRKLEEEDSTNQAAVAAVKSMATGLSLSLEKVVTYPAQELKTAHLLFAGTDAEGCLNGIEDYMPKAISDEVQNYNDNTGDVLAKLARLSRNWKKVKNNYMAAYQRALSGIDVCAKTYPNKDSIDRLKSCIESMTRIYFTTANATMASAYPSPSMIHFQVVVTSATTAVNNVVTKAFHFLNMLYECSTLDPDFDHASYEEELKKWKGYNVTLDDQISDAQNQSYIRVSTIEQEMKNYYNLNKLTMEKYVLESRGLGYYKEKLYSYLSPYYNTVTATSMDNPGDLSCTDTAKVALDAIVNSSSIESLSCDVDIIEDTKNLTSEINADFLALNKKLPAIGNTAILACFMEGYIFAPDTILDCFKLVIFKFDIDYDGQRSAIVSNVNKIYDYVATFFNGTTLPCGSTSLQQVYLDAETALYTLQRCLYTTSGTTYVVTTPVPAAGNTTHANETLY